jgi:S-adenosyl methyltransferase
VESLVGEAGIRQFLDIGTGIPTAGNTHEVAQEMAPDCRIVGGPRVSGRRRSGRVMTAAD